MDRRPIFVKVLETNQATPALALETEQMLKQNAEDQEPKASKGVCETFASCSTLGPDLAWSFPVAISYWAPFLQRRQTSKQNEVVFQVQNTGIPAATFLNGQMIQHEGQIETDRYWQGQNKNKNRIWNRIRSKFGGGTLTLLTITGFMQCHYACFFQVDVGLHFSNHAHNFISLAFVSGYIRKFICDNSL